AEFAGTLREVFEIKRVPLSLLGKIADHREYHRADFPAVQGTVKPEFKLHEFDFYVDYVIRKCDDLKTLWDE
ncbi:MAG TPA: hypothetical protein VML55_22470, partial [Planctomycetaceae bacterium]|nr:hypothetical protein [Planctomycetaceae bacterium]